MTTRRGTIAIALAAFLWCLCAVWFFTSTHWALEDGKIVERIAARFASGDTLSFNPGERISSATSPIFALTVGSLGRLGLPVPVGQRLLGVLGMLAAGLALSQLPLTNLPRWLPAAMFWSLPPITAYALAGLETGLYCGAIAWGLIGLITRRPMVAGIAVGLATAIRPDGAILLLLVTAALAFGFFDRGRPAVAAFAVALLIPAAGAVVHWRYYGLWVPHTVAAKAGAYHIEPAENARKYLSQLFLAQPLVVVLYVLALLALVAALRGTARWPFVVAIYWGAYLGVFVARAPLFDWYLIPPTVPLVMLAAAGLDTGVGYLRQTLGPRIVERMLAAAPVGIVVAAVCLLGFYAPGKRQVMVWELGTRDSAGRQLAALARPGDLVFTESLGFIGAAAPEQVFVDWPGLVDPTAAALAAGKGRFRGFGAIITAKEPAWLALRQDEWDGLRDELKGRFEVVTFVHGGSGKPYVLARRSKP